MRPLRCWQGRETEAARRGASPPGKHEQGRTQHHETTPRETPSPKQQKEHGDVPPCPPKEGAGAAPWQFSPLSPSLPYRSQGCAMKMLQHFYMVFFFPRKLSPRSDLPTLGDFPVAPSCSTLRSY